MLLTAEKVLEVYKKVAVLQEQYKTYALVADASAVSVEDLESVIQDVHDTEITKTEVPFEGVFLRGIMERYEGKIVIRVKRNMADDWKRFTAVKEMCHAFVDEQQDWSTEGVATLHDLLFEYSIQNGTVADAETQSEVLAEIAAIELLYPYSARKADIPRVNSQDLTLAAIAAHHAIPISIVAKALATDYQRIADQLWPHVPK